MGRAGESPLFLFAGRRVMADLVEPATLVRGMKAVTVIGRAYVTGKERVFTVGGDLQAPR
jgi:hypothetical protein